MRIHRVVTHVGNGEWGTRPYDLALLDERREYWDLAGLRRAEVTRALLAFRQGERPWEWRAFAGTEERRGFMDAVMRSYDLYAPAPNPDPALLQAYHPAQELIEEHVYSVSFIGGHLSLGFAAGMLEVFDWPRYLVGDDVHDAAKPGYRDTVSDLLDCCVTAIDECLDAGLVVRFLGGAALHVALGGRGEAPFAGGAAA